MNAAYEKYGKEKVCSWRRASYYRNYAKNRQVNLVKSRTPRCRFNLVRASAKKRGISFTLSYEDFVTFYQLPCHYCGDLTPSANFDRIDSSKGYELSNVVPCCRWCNVAKNDVSQDDFYRRCQMVIDYRRLMTSTAPTYGEMDARTVGHPSHLLSDQE